jgi:hypothetical protein
VSDELRDLEAEIQRSRFEMSEVEKFLIQRHEAKIAELEKPKSKPRLWLTLAKEAGLLGTFFLGLYQISQIFAWSFAQVLLAL